jgi:hypothetical protein
MGGRGLDYLSQNREKLKVIVNKLINHWLLQNPGNLLRSQVIITFTAGDKHAGKRKLIRHEC